MKNFLKKSAIYLKGDQLLYRLNKTPRVLFWHGVDDTCDANIEPESYETNIFIKQIKYLHQYFEIISLDEFYNRFRKNNFTNREIVLTFDDGYANNLYKVAPILNTYSIPFAVFISTEHIEKGELFPTSIARMILLGAGLNKVSIPSLSINNRGISNSVEKVEIYKMVISELKTQPLVKVRNIVNDLIKNLSNQEYVNIKKKYKSTQPMTWEEVVQLHQAGATIGSHCKYHICCHGNQDTQEVKKQIIESKKIIEEKLQAECKYFAYPNGDYTSISNSFVKEAGYTMGFSTEKNKRIIDATDSSVIPRIGVPLCIDTLKIIVNLYPKR